MDGGASWLDGWLPPIYIFTGQPGEGKTSFLLTVLGILEEKGLKIRGIAAPGHVRDGIRSGFSIIDLSTGAFCELASIVPSPESSRYGHFYFRPEGLLFGQRALSFPVPEITDLFVVDEVGLFELRGKIWAQYLDRIFEFRYPPMIWTVRHSLLDQVIARWRMERPVVVDINLADPLAVVHNLLHEVGIFRMENPDVKKVISAHPVSRNARSSSGSERR